MSRLPPSASVAHTAGDGRLFAPSAARNSPAIVALMTEIAPHRGRALEIASGTGEHAVALARAIPGIDWQPTEIAPERIASIAAHRADAARPNLRAPECLDATLHGWGTRWAGIDMVYLVNLLHLIPEAAAETVLREAAAALAPGGTLMVYGPFLRAGVLTSPGDAQFDAQLRAGDPAIGYKDDRWMLALLRDAALTPRAPRDMPANNLAFIAVKGLS